MLIETLQTYMLITPESPRIEIYQRRNDLAWEYQSIAIDPTDLANQDANHDPSIQIPNLELTFPLSLLYENIDFSPEANAL